METNTSTRTVTIPNRDDHDARQENTVTLTVAWVCPVPGCGGPRGEVARGLSFDGSRRLVVDTWTNACGHVDLYEDVRAEAGHSEPVHFDDDF